MISIYFLKKIVFKLPKIIRFNNHKLYRPHKIIPVAAQIVKKKLFNDKPNNIKISPTKPLVPGKAIFDKIKKIKKKII